MLPPDVLAIDQIAYEDFRADLTDEESQLLDLMIQSQNNGQKGRGRFKKMFIRETGSTYSNYEATLMSLQKKFYHHYGSDSEKEDFENFSRHWRPRTPMYHGRSNRLNSLSISRGKKEESYVFAEDSGGSKADFSLYLIELLC